MKTLAAAYKSLTDWENELLADLPKLRVATLADLKVHIPLFYKLGDSYGCHVVRSLEDIEKGYRYKKDTDIRGGIEAGIFYVQDL